MLSQVQQQAEELSVEDREGLLAWLIHSLPATPEGTDNEEVMRREQEMDSGEIVPVSHAEFLRQVRGA